ncbi:MAG TPA: VOC family protein [Gemmatimonadaceae bacterium]|jgi:predicted enzyme related to lactoylglutathione lyase|nr:VOC family protein [Gemmatimonadaceae bacterium]
MKVTKTYFMLMAADVVRGASFYKKAFGLKAGGYESPEWTELVQNGATVALHRGGASSSERDTGLGFYVDDIDAACNAVAASGGKIIKPPEARAGEGIKLATAVDTEGNRFSITQELPRA